MSVCKHIIKGDLVIRSQDMFPCASCHFRDGYECKLSFAEDVREYMHHLGSLNNTELPVCEEGKQLLTDNRLQWKKEVEILCEIRRFPQNNPETAVLYAIAHQHVSASRWPKECLACPYSNMRDGLCIVSHNSPVYPLANISTERLPRCAEGAYILEDFARECWVLLNQREKEGWFQRETA